MAENLPKVLEEELTCHICTEIYSDPVQLPCQHSFCRACLQYYVQSCLRTSETSASAMVCCPICRKSLELDIESVSKLPVHFTVANIIEKYQVNSRGDARPLKMRKEAGPPKCSMCEDNECKPAVQGCETCKCLYCQECLDAFHPMRGPISKHKLVEAEYYTVTPVCEEHDEPLKVFCADCKQLCCYPCSVQNHAKHDIKAAMVAFSEEKDRMATKTLQLKKAYQEISFSIAELSKREEHAKQCFQHESRTIEREYQKIQGTLDNWRSKSIKRTEQKRDYVLKETEKELGRLQLQLTDIENYLKEKGEYFGSTHREAVPFLLVSEDTIQNLNKRIKRTADALDTIAPLRLVKREKHDMGQMPESELLLSERKSDDSLEFMLGRPTVICPMFSLGNGLHECVSVQNEGKDLVNVGSCANNEALHGALADHSFNDGNLYWEIDVAYSVKVEQVKSRLMYSAGVLQQGSPLSQYFGDSPHSWGVAIQKTAVTYNFTCWYDQKCTANTPVCPGGKPPRCGTIRQGFYLDCNKRTLTILDCTSDRVLHTFSDIDLSQPLTPGIATYAFNKLDVSTHLRTGRDISTLPTCLCRFPVKH